MIKIIVGSNAHREEKIVTPDRTIRDILEEAQINYHVGTVCLNNDIIESHNMDTTIGDYSDGDDMLFLTVIENKCNAMRIVNAMGTYVVKMDFGPEEIAILEDNDEESLQLKKDKKVLFAVGVGETSEISRFGVVFSEVNDGKFTMSVDAESDEDFALRYGKTINMLRKMETQIQAAVDLVSDDAMELIERIEHI